MKILVIGYEAEAKYSGVFRDNFCSALDHAGLSYDVASPGQSLLNFPNYDLYIGAGDELLRRLPEQVALIKSMGGVAIDIRTKKMPNKPKTWVQSIFMARNYQVDYVLTHMPDSRKRCLYIGQGLNEKLLYPEHDEMFTIFVDHYMPGRSAKVQRILDQCKRMAENRHNIRIWYQNSQGIVENVFQEDKSQYKPIPFSQLSAYYRKTHVFLPTHRETQGIVAAEVGMCGGITLLEPWMYPKKTLENIPHHFYQKNIVWPDTVHIEANMKFTRSHYGMDVFAQRIKAALDSIAAEAL